MSPSTIHLIFGSLLSIIPVIILVILEAGNHRLLKPLSLFTAITSWLLLWPSANIYLGSYQTLKKVVIAGPTPWAHTIIMETKEHWGLLIPFIATLAAGLVFSNRAKQSAKWWGLLSITTFLIAAMGRLVAISIR